MVTYSHSELRALLKRAFEGAGWCSAHYEEAAQNIVTAEAYGMKSLEHVVKVWPRLLSLPTSVGVIPQLDSNAIDIQMDSVARVGQAICDYAFANARTDACSLLEVRHCRDRGFILPSLVLCSQPGYHLIARWYTDDYVYSVLTDSSNQSSADCVQANRIKTGKRNTDTLFIACSKSEEHIQRFQDKNNSVAINRSLVWNLTSQEINKNYEKTKRDGIKVKREWVELFEKQANNILVPSSERSRAGAGD